MNGIWEGKQLMEEKKEPKRRRSSQGNALMAVVCVYIIYLGIKILRDYAKGSVKGAPAWSQILFGILFIAIGGLFLLNYVRLYLQERKEEKLSAEEKLEMSEEEKKIEDQSPAEDLDRVEDQSQSEDPENEDQAEDQDQV